MSLGLEFLEIFWYTQKAIEGIKSIFVYSSDTQLANSLILADIGLVVVSLFTTISIIITLEKRRTEEIEGGI